MWNGREEPNEYMKLLQDRFESLTEEKDGKATEDKDTLLICTLGPEQYGIETEMLDFLKANPKISLSEVVQHYVEICPDEPLKPFEDEE